MFPLIMSVCCLGLLILSGLVSFSLRLYAVSRLEDLCDQAQSSERFREILKKEQRAQTSWDSLMMIALTGAVFAISFSSIPMIESTASGFWQRGVELGLLGIMLAVLVVLVGVIIPWSVARISSELILFRLWPLISLVTSLFFPVTIIAEWLDVLMHRISDRDAPENGEAGMVADEIRSYIDEGEREGFLESGASRMINRVIELSDVTVASIMTPRTDIIFVSSTATYDQTREELIKSGHSRLPVIGDSTDDIKGILYAKDLLKESHETTSVSWDILSVSRQPYYVPETTGIDTLLETMKKEHVHIAIVLDEYGGVAGLVTMEDILEEIVGEITDEYDEEEEQRIVSVEDGLAIVEGRVHIDELNEMFDYDLPEDEDYDTIGGFIFTQLGRIPKETESITWQNLELTVLEADARKVVKVQIRHMKEQTISVEE